MIGSPQFAEPSPERGAAGTRLARARAYTAACRAAEREARLAGREAHARHAAALAACDRAEAEEAAALAEAGEPVLMPETPIPVKTAAFRFNVSERTMRRFAKAGGGVKIGNRQYVYPSLVVMRG